MASYYSILTSLLVNDSDINTKIFKNFCHPLFKGKDKHNIGNLIELLYNLKKFHEIK